MNKKRPVNLDLRTIKLPLSALTSFLHRVSGFLLFLFLILMLYTFGKSLDSEEGFNEIKGILFSPFGKIITWIVYSTFIYHLVAGIRHIIMDFGVGHTLEGGKRGSIAVIVVSGLLIAIGALWIW
ncbi:succinate dehydrogenase, cytochrome b556 subunit [Pseudomonas sp. URMO17WK12:I12]|uniref:succinate dehydrogenase, cytochrome b556 subunit n=1 Tax=Pseudomonas sp. URMO17WK12:I12 TaxID=1259797 RepID=UPI000484C618|nr:succinate dehydrogenase, cytochrome b556 subunit [Pseudomonas sp. URMO17WK12:I12]